MRSTIFFLDRIGRIERRAQLVAQQREIPRLLVEQDHLLGRKAVACNAFRLAAALPSACWARCSGRRCGGSPKSGLRWPFIASCTHVC